MEESGYDSSALPARRSLQKMKRTLRSRRWAPSIAAVAAFGLLGATCAYWALQLLAPPVTIAPTGSLVDTQSAPDLAAAQSLFGTSASGPVATSAVAVDIRVLGVAASPTRGSAVLVVDAGAPRAFLVGDEVGSDLRLVEVRSDAAVLERNGARIELPAPQRPSVALLSSGPAAPGSPPVEAAPPLEGHDAESASAPDARARGMQAPDARAPAPLPPDDPAIEAATLSPRSAPAAGSAQRSGIRPGSARRLDTSPGAPADGPSH